MNFLLKEIHCNQMNVLSRCGIMNGGRSIKCLNLMFSHLFSRSMLVVCVVTELRVLTVNSVRLVLIKFHGWQAPMNARVSRNLVS